MYMYNVLELLTANVVFEGGSNAISEVKQQ